MKKQFAMWVSVLGFLFVIGFRIFFFGWSLDVALNYLFRHVQPTNGQLFLLFFGQGLIATFLYMKNSREGANPAASKR